MKNQETYPVTVNQVALDVTITKSGIDDYFIDRVELPTSAANLWPLLKNSSLDDQIHEAIDKAIGVSGREAVARQAAADEKMDWYRQA